MVVADVEDVVLVDVIPLGVVAYCVSVIVSNFLLDIADNIEYIPTGFNRLYWGRLCYASNRLYR